VAESEEEISLSLCGGTKAAKKRGATFVIISFEGFRPSWDGEGRRNESTVSELDLEERGRRIYPVEICSWRRFHREVVDMEACTGSDTTQYRLTIVSRAC